MGRRGIRQRPLNTHVMITKLLPSIIILIQDSLPCVKGNYNNDLFASNGFHRQSNRLDKYRKDTKTINRSHERSVARRLQEELSIVEDMDEGTEEIVEKVTSRSGPPVLAPAPIVSAPSVGGEDRTVASSPSTFGQTSQSQPAVEAEDEERYNEALAVPFIINFDDDNPSGERLFFDKSKHAKQFKESASRDHGHVTQAVTAGLKKKKEKAKKYAHAVVGLATHKVEKAKSIKKEVHGFVADSISAGLHSFKSKVHKKKSKKKSKKKKSKSKKGKGGHGILNFEFTFSFRDEETGQTVEETKKLKCAANSTEFVPTYTYSTFRTINVDPDSDAFEEDAICHYASLGLNSTEGVLEHLFLLERAPSSMPSSSHAPSFSVAPSFSPSISLEPSVSFLPTETPKGLTCRQRPITSVSNRRLKVKLSNTDHNGFFPLKQHNHNIRRSLQINTEIPNDDYYYDDKVEEIASSANAALGDTADLLSQGVTVLTKEDKEALAIANGWNPNDPDARPKFWYTLPYCDEVPTMSPAPSTTSLPSFEPSISHAPSLSIAPTSVPSIVPTGTPTTSNAPTGSRNPTLSPTRPGYRGPLVGIGCELAKNNVTEIAIGSNIQVEFVYELVTNVSNVSASGVIPYLESEMHSIVTPALLNCDLVNDSRRLDSLSGVQYLIPYPKDELFSEICNINQVALEEDQQCVRILSKMTAIVDEGFPYIENDVKMEVLKTAKVGLDSGAYNRPAEGIIQTRFLGLMQEDGQLSGQVPAGASSNVTPVNSVTGFGSAFISMAVIGVIVIAFLAVRKRQYTETVIMEELVDDESEFDKKHLPKSPDNVTVRTAYSAPGSEFSADLDASPSKYVKVLGQSTPTSIVDDLRDSEAKISRSKSKFFKDTDSSILRQHKSTMDVHSCTSATCEICQPWKNNNPSFVSTGAIPECTKAETKAKAPRSDYKLKRKRAYKIDDTVVL